MSCDCSPAHGPLFVLPPNTDGRFLFTIRHCDTGLILDLSLTGTLVEWVFTPSPTAPAVLLTKTIANAGLAAANLPLGQIFGLIKPADTALLQPWNKRSWFVRVTLPSGKVYVALTGEIYLGTEAPGDCGGRGRVITIGALCATAEASTGEYPAPPVYATVVQLQEETEAREAGDVALAASIAAISPTLLRVFHTNAVAVSDADLAMGSTTFGADQTAPLQALLNEAITGPIEIIWGGKYSVTGLKVYPGTKITVLEGCGAILRNGSNKPILANAHPRVLSQFDNPDSASRAPINTTPWTNDSGSGYTTFTGASRSGFTAAKAGGVAVASIGGATITPGKWYRISYTLTPTSGQAPSVSFGSTSITALTPGTHTLDLLADGAFFVIYNTAATSFTLSAVSVYEIPIDANITIEGRGIWNGNGANQLHDTPTEGWITALRLVGVKDVTLRGFTILASTTFAILFGNWLDLIEQDITVLAAGEGTLPNTDGLHHCGPGMRAYITNIIGRCFDDLVALNADDAAFVNTTIFGTYGPITDVIIDGVTFLDGSITGIRLLSGGSRIDRISISKVRGQTSLHWLIGDCLGQFANGLVETGAGNYGSVLVYDVDINCRVRWGSKVEQLIFRDIRRTEFTSTWEPTFTFDAGTNAEQLILDGITLFAPAGATAYTQIEFNGECKDFIISNPKFIQSTPAANYPIRFYLSAFVQRFTLRGARGFGYSDFVYPHGDGTVVMETVMLDNVMSTEQVWSVSAGVTIVSPTAITFPASLTAATNYVAQTVRRDLFIGEVKATSRLRINLPAALALTAWTNDVGAPYSTFTGASATGFTAAQISVVTSIAQLNGVAITPGKKYRIAYTLALNSGQLPSIAFGGPSITTIPVGTGFLDLVADGSAIYVYSTANTNFVLSAVFVYELHQQAVDFLIRGECLAGWGTTARGYLLGLVKGPGESTEALRMQRGQDGAFTDLAAPITAASFAYGADYDISFGAKGVEPVVSAQIQRVSDGYWLTSAGAWQAGAASCFSTIDTGAPRQTNAIFTGGHVGYHYRANGGAVGSATLTNYALTQLV